VFVSVKSLEVFLEVWGVSADLARSVCSSLRRIVLFVPGYASRFSADGRYVFLQEIKIDKDLDVSAIAGSTIGFTGADLANLVNEAALLAARKVS
jgi:SpoVK/Ycf46/Vps4 family AAA+-type ATPase